MTCAFAVREAIKKIPGVEKVEVSLNKGLATVTLKPGNTATAGQFWEVVKNNGFTPKATKVVARGEVLPNAKFKVSGANSTYDLSPAQPAGRTGTAEAILTPGKTEMKITSFKEQPR